jgi:hypothetical protein
MTGPARLAGLLAVFAVAAGVVAGAFLLTDQGVDGPHPYLLLGGVLLLVGAVLALVVALLLIIGSRSR